MYLQGSVHGIGVRFLIDTGDRPRLYEVTGNVLCADGKPLEVVGKGKFTLLFGGKRQQHCVIVANIGLTVGVLGLDVLEKVGSEIDFVNQFEDRRHFIIRGD
ncbi:hypothetical protein ACJMK2_017464 [Sinanodonta woodiana]|uniref:Peptidase A2 domain-containing protein n=1 Tax=Sinanodonta woodiana TaxID=1069815 RepID=A0ABD3UBS8_SINWO